MAHHPDAAPRRREPIFNLPTAVTACIAALVLVHALRSLALPPATDLGVLLDLAFVPARLTLWWHPSSAEELLRRAAAGDAEAASIHLALARFVVGEARAAPWTVLTYALLHGSWTHVILNGVWFAAFGTPVARRCGSVRFLALAALSAAAGAAAHLAFHPYGVAPLIGASAAVSGLMAASVRFIFGPLEPLGGEGGRRRQAVLSLPELLVERRAVVFLGVWLVSNLLFGLAAPPLGFVEANVAWEAHLGGFVAGLLLFPAFDERGVRRRRAGA